MSPAGVTLGCATPSLQAGFSPVEQSIQLQPFSCQPVPRTKILCPMAKMPAFVVKCTLQVVFQTHCYS